MKCILVSMLAVALGDSHGLGDSSCPKGDSSCPEEQLTLVQRQATALHRLSPTVRAFSILPLVETVESRFAIATATTENNAVRLQGEGGATLAAPAVQKTAAPASKIGLRARARTVLSSAVKSDENDAECQQGLPTPSDLAAWGNVYDALNGDSWNSCAGTRQDPCSCREHQTAKICCEHDGPNVRIKKIILSSNNLRGLFPAAFCSLTRLQTLWLDDNFISGTLPTCIRSLNRMEEFQMSQNLLHGTLPTNIGQHMPALRTFALYENDVYESSQGPHCKQLYRVSKDGRDAKYPRDWSCGGISGDLFMSLRGASSLQDISADANSFNGSVPEWLCEAFPGLWRLDLHDNKFSGTLPMSLLQCRGLRIFQIAATSIRGLLPPMCELETWDISGIGLDLHNSKGKCGNETLQSRFSTAANL